MNEEQNRRFNLWFPGSQDLIHATTARRHLCVRRKGAHIAYYVVHEKESSIIPAILHITHSGIRLSQLNGSVLLCKVGLGLAFSQWRKKLLACDGGQDCYIYFTFLVESCWFAHLLGHFVSKGCNIRLLAWLLQSILCGAALGSIMETTICSEFDSKAAGWHRMPMILLWDWE